MQMVGWGVGSICRWRGVGPKCDGGVGGPYTDGGVWGPNADGGVGGPYTDGGGGGPKCRGQGVWESKQHTTLQMASSHRHSQHASFSVLIDERQHARQMLPGQLPGKLSDLLDDEVQSTGITQDHACFSNDLARVLPPAPTAIPGALPPC